MPDKKISTCKFCNSRKCKTRIVTDDGKYDEVACDHHIGDLERDADRVLGSNNGVIRHITSSDRVKRGEPYAR